MDEVVELFANRGAGAYFGERVSMLEHALQTAHFAREDHAPPDLIIAALLHDVGHLVEDVPDDIADWHADAKHEQVGGAWLAQRFGPEISNPVMLHVAAKRYLCAIDPDYLGQLSPASVMTLKLQGGPMSDAEMAAFEHERFHRDAVRIRKWDDRGKVAGLRTLALDRYRDLIEAATTR